MTRWHFGHWHIGPVTWAAIAVVAFSGALAVAAGL
jgi:hypothetical protein